MTARGARAIGEAQSARKRRNFKAGTSGYADGGGDTVAHENVHAGLASRATSHVILQDTEIPIRHFHRVLEDHVAFSRNA